MRPSEVRCPTCGADLDTHNPGIVMAVCGYCSTASYWNQDALERLGEQSLLPEGFSRLYRGASGTLSQTRFVVLGRIRYSFGHGFWDEWFLELEGETTGWLVEDDHELALEYPAKKLELEEFEQYSPGDQLTVDDTVFVVQEVGQAVCLGVEGTLPIVVQTGEKYAFVDASSPDGRETLGIEFDEETPTVFRGRWLDWTELQLDEEGGDW